MTASTTFVGPLLMAACHLLRSSDLFFRVGVVKTLPVSIIIFWEHFFNLILLLPILWHYRNDYRKLTFLDLVLFLLIGFGASALGILCFTQAFHYLNPALVILLQKLQPLITIILGMILLRERFRPAFYGWAFLAVVSSYFVSFSLTNPFSGEWSQLGLGTLLALGAVFFWGTGTVWGKMLLSRYNQLFILGNRFLFGTIFTFVLAYSINSTFQIGIIFDMSQGILWKIIYMAWVPGLLATGLFYFGLVHVSAAVASILELIFPLASVLIMWGYFGQSLDYIQITAAVLLFISMGRVSDPNMKYTNL